jgi:short-subunit dehydrogenase involved in D-alanine esterification of teichoic acids
MLPDEVGSGSRKAATPAVAPPAALPWTVVPACQSSKAALDSLTIGLAKQLRDTPIKEAPLAPEDATQVVHRAASPERGRPARTFMDAHGEVPR